MIAHRIFMDAEVEYRLARATAGFPHGRRHKVRRLPTLHLPKPRRRPLAVA